jgi:hypothetical protein
MAASFEVRDDEILVTLPGTSYTVTYYKSASSPRPVAKNFPTKDDERVPLTREELLARIWKAANDKARELG